MARKVLGIIGGMGPEATALMFRKIVNRTRAGTDQDHLEILIHNNPGIPDRTRALLDGGASPVGELLRSAEMLRREGVDIIIIPCMTAHCFLEDLLKSIRIPIIDAVRETARWVRDAFRRTERVGIIGSTGTIRSGIFQSRFREYGLRTIVPSDAMQETGVMEAIYGDDGVKAGKTGAKARESLLRCCGELAGNGAQVIVAGCTEVPLVIGQADVGLPFIDPMDLLAEAAIRECLGDQFLLPSPVRRKRFECRRPAENPASLGGTAALQPTRPPLPPVKTPGS